MKTVIDKKTQIADIVATRQPLITQIEARQARLLAIARAIRSLSDTQTQLMKSNDPIILECLKSIDFSAFQPRFNTELENLNKLKSRFSRKTLNIGVIGRARQGKSRLLQTLSGLSSNEIPDGDRETCTGVRSTIYHHPIDSYAEIVFYSEEEFLREVIAPYYHALNLGPVPVNLDQFAKAVLPSSSLAVQSAMGKHFLEYRNFVQAYRPLLKVGAPQRISLQDLRQYVAQDRPDGKRDLHNYLAVRDVKIYTKFPYEDVGQIALLDMPGLGDTGLGDEERLIKALGEDIDFALFVRMPKSTGDLWEKFDTQLYDTAQQALKDLLPLNDWSYMVLNNTVSGSKGNNTTNCVSLQNGITSTFPGNHPFVESVIVDCTDSLKVNANLLEPVLNYLLDNMNRLDRQYVEACQQGITKLQQEIEAELEKALLAVESIASSDDSYKRFRECFMPTWKELKIGLDSLVNEMRKKSNQEDPAFVDYFVKRFEVCKNDTGIPTIEQIKDLASAKGAFKKVYFDCFDEIRTRLTYKFISLDEALKKSMSDVKSKTAQVFLQQGRLAGVTQAKEDKFFDEMGENSNLGRLRHVFRAFARYELSYRGFFQQRIRKHLDRLITDRATDLKLSDPSNPTTCATEVFNLLKKAQADTVSALQTELSKYFVEPSQAAFAVVEEFVDQTIRAEGVDEEWGNYYRSVQDRVWEADFKKITDRKRILDEWHMHVKNAQQISKLAPLQ
ncbi:MAG: hypothetical protein JO202_15265 [Ktedonobacteraceae bacterium]|nr:hypothetical protein [Ktedonobacteraceae bacterium]